MRLLRLDLDRYGPFKSKSIAFDPNAKLHVIVGPNEAGKTCSLEAITDLLFGVERTSRSTAATIADARRAFLRATEDLRLGALISREGGSQLEFRRRKNKPTLTDETDRPLPDDALAPFIGGLTREVFRRAFGLDASSLRESANDLEATDGELGAALFSAASGLRGFVEIKSRMEDEADGIFAERKAQARTFYQALDRYDTARKQLKDREVRAGDLKQLRESIRAQQAILDGSKVQRAGIAAELSRVQRLKRTAPIVNSIADLECSLLNLGALPQVAEGTGGSILAAIKEAASASRGLAEARKHEIRLREAAGSVDVDARLLEAAEKIEATVQDSGAYRKALNDLPGVEREEAEASRKLLTLATRLGRIDADGLGSDQPDDASRAKVAEFVASGKDLGRALRNCEADLARECEALADKMKERDRRGVVRDPRPYRERWSALAPAVRVAEQVHERTTELHADIVELQRAGARLSPAIDDLASISAISLPSRDTIARHAKQWEEVQSLRRDTAKELSAADAEVAKFSSDLDRLSGAGDLPSAERISAARETRDRQWHALAAYLRGETPAVDAAQLGVAIAAYEAATARADVIADRALSESGRVVAHAEAARKLAEQRNVVRRLRDKLAEIESIAGEARTQWEAAWTNAGVAPLPPAEMANWRSQFESLLDRHDKLQRRRVTIESEQERCAAGRPEIAKLADELSLAPMPELGVSEMAARIEREIERITAAWDAGTTLDTLIADLEERVATQRNAVHAAEALLERWRAQFATALPRIGLAGSADIAEADAVLSVWKDVPGAISHHEGLRRRVAGMKRDATRFEDKVRELLSAAAPDLSPADPEAALSTLHRRLVETRAGRARLIEIERQLAETVEETSRWAAQQENTDQTLAALAVRVGAPVDAALEPLARSLQERDRLIAALHQKRAELINASDGLDEEVVRRDLAGFDPDAMEAVLSRLNTEDLQLVEESQKTYAAKEKSLERLSSIEGSLGAEVALQQRRNAEAELLDCARNWAVLRIGALMISTAIERQRANRQAPLMARASELFAGLTGGAFAGLGQSYDDDDKPYLTGLRASGGELAIKGMSEGARDQLCLALRLAYLEDFASRSEPTPFIADDLFASFDDERTAHGLKALAAVGEKVQPIVFTHHRYVADITARVLGAQADIIELK